MAAPPSLVGPLARRRVVQGGGFASEGAGCACSGARAPSRPPRASAKMRRRPSDDLMLHERVARACDASEPRRASRRQQAPLQRALVQQRLARPPPRAVLLQDRRACTTALRTRPSLVILRNDPFSSQLPTSSPALPCLARILRLGKPPQPTSPPSISLRLPPASTSFIDYIPADLLISHLPSLWTYIPSHTGHWISLISATTTHPAFPFLSWIAVFTTTCSIATDLSLISGRWLRTLFESQLDRRKLR